MSNILGASWRTGSTGFLGLLTAIGAAAALIHNKDFDFGGAHWLAVYSSFATSWGLLQARDNKVTSEKVEATGTAMDGAVKIGILAIASSLFLTGCQQFSASKVSPDGTRTQVQATSLFSNSAFKGLKGDSTTKTTSSLLSITGSQTEPNVESITASADALGSIIGTAAATAGKAAVKP